MSELQYQNRTKWWCYQWVGLNLMDETKSIFRYHTNGVSNQVSSNSDHEIKSYSCSNSTTKMGKNEKVGKKFSGLQNGAIKGLQIVAGFRDSKSGQEGLHTRAALLVSKQSKKIKNRGILPLNTCNIVQV